MKFSLREVFNIHTQAKESASDTSTLLEMYGLNREAQREDKDSEARGVTVEGIQKAVDQLLEGRVSSESVAPPTAEKKTVNRDDLVLDRWRKMAGL